MSINAVFNPQVMPFKDTASLHFPSFNGDGVSDIAMLGSGRAGERKQL